MPADTNILPDLKSGDGRWAAWSHSELEVAASRGPILINYVVFTALSTGFEPMEECESFLAEIDVPTSPITCGTLFLAGQVFRSYRRRGGPRSGALPDCVLAPMPRSRACGC